MPRNFSGFPEISADEEQLILNQEVDRLVAETRGDWQASVILRELVNHLVATRAARDAASVAKITRRKLNKYLR